MLYFTDFGYVENHNAFNMLRNAFSSWEINPEIIYGKPYNVISITEHCLLYMTLGHLRNIRKVSSNHALALNTVKRNANLILIFFGTPKGRDYVNGSSTHTQFFSSKNLQPFLRYFKIGIKCTFLLTRTVPNNTLLLI